VIPPPPIENSGVWPYEAPRQYETFITGTDDNGEPVSHSCDPDALANNFGSNPDAPDYLTPVFFRRSVLDKYYADTDRYRVKDGHLREASTWGLRMDNALDDHVAVFLGDLGTDLPFREQQYSKSYNIPSSGRLSETAIRRSFRAQFYDSDRVEHRFVKSFNDLFEAWQVHFGWPLYKPLPEGDAHVVYSIHVPTNTSLGQFDDQIMRLAKLVADSLNERGIASATRGPEQREKGIAKLKRLLCELGLETAVCSVLGRVQGVRSHSAAHRKGSDFDLALLLRGTPDPQVLFAELLENLIERFDALTAEVAKQSGS
jgi:hypothetical protein